jgi:RHS repeat-associated protein
MEDVPMSSLQRVLSRAVLSFVFAVLAAGSLLSQTITSISPTSGTRATLVTITGTGFGTTQGSNYVMFATTKATIKSWSSTQITCIPQNTGAGNISVYVSVGGIQSNQVSFTLTNPVINSLSINSAPVDQEITINGSNYGTTQGSSSVVFNNVTANPSSWSNTAITVPVPAGATTGNIVVTVNGVAATGYMFMVVPPTPPPGVQFIQGNWKSGASGTTSTIAFPIIQNARDLNVVVVSWLGTNSVTSVTDSAGNTYALAVGPTAGSSETQSIYYAKDILEAGENVVSVVFASAPSGANLRVAEYSGLDLNSPLDVTAAAIGTGSAQNETASSGNATTTNANDLVVGASAVTGMGTQGPGTGYTNRVITTNNGGNILEDRIVTSTGSYAGTASLGCDDPWVMQMVAFKEAPNQAPNVNAGPNQSITWPTNTVTLNGIATDDGLPNNTLAISWSKVSGPGTVTFGNPSAAISTATFSTVGSYVLQLSANDSQLSSSSQVTITVYPAVQVSAGSNQNITLPVNFLTLNGSASGGGLPLITSWSTVSGPGSVAFASVGSPVTTAAFTAAGVYDIRLTATNGETTVSADATITVNPPANTPPSGTIVLAPGSAGPIVTGTSQQIQATVTNNTGAAIANASVTFTVTGPNKTTGTATTNSSGIATFSYTGTNAGVDAVVATTTVGSLSLTSNTSMISWVVQSVSVTASTVQGEFFTSDGSGTFDTPSTAQPAFTQTFASLNFNPPTGSIPGMPSTIGISTVPFTNVTTDANGNYTGSVIAQGNGLQAGVGTLSTFQAVFTGTFTVPAAGNVSFNFFNADGFVLGIGSGATRVSGSLALPPSSTAFHGYPVMGSFNMITAPVTNRVTVNFPAAGTYPYEVDYTNSNQAALISPSSTWKYKLANASLGAITGISRANGVVTVDVNAALYDLAAGMTVAIAGVTDSTNFPNSTQTVTGLTVYPGGAWPNQPGTAITVNWAGNSASSSGGTVSEQFNEPFYLIGFDDSVFSLGQAPFTNVVGGVGTAGCPFIGKTLFPTLGVLDLRKTVTLPPGATNVQALVAIDNDFTLWVNGNEVINQDHETCAEYWNYTVPIPNNFLQSGTNLIAVQARDRGLDTGFDLSLTGPTSLVPSKPLTLVMSTNPNNGQSSLSIAPTSNLSLTMGQPATFTALVTDQTGKPVANIPVTFNVAGSNPLQTTIVSNSNGIGTFTYTGFYAGVDVVEAGAQVGTAALVSSQTQVTWSYLTNLPPPTGTLVLTPNTAQTQTIGQSQTFTIQALNGSGQGVPNVPVTLLISIANSQQLTATTNSSGVATFSYSGTIAGTDTVEANAIINGTAAFSNLNTVQWKPPQQQQITYIFTPQGWISSPTIGTVIQNQVPIVLQAGITLTSGTLKFFPSNSSNVTVLNANTTGTGPLTLGTFDATLLANGQYTIQLQAINSAGAAQLNEIVVSVTGEYKPGREVVTVTDFKIPLAGIPISIGRTFDSLNRGNVEDFGNGWALGSNVNLQVDLLMNVAFTIDGKTETFYFTPQSAGQALFPWLLVPHYTPQPGVHGTLTSNGCGILIYQNGTIVQDASGVACFPGGNYSPTIYTYTDPAGRVYTMTSTGQLQTIQDLNRNTLTFSPAGITSTVGGVAIPFVRDSQGRITKITDLNGNNYLYSYDSPCGTGNLCTVTFPGTTTIQANYTYFADHSLNTQLDPNSNTTTYTYYAQGDPNQGRLQSVTGPAVPGPNGTTQYVTQYTYNVAANSSTVKNPDGGSITTAYDRFGKPLSVTDALGRTTTYTYDAHENLISQTDGFGNVTAYTYDANGCQTSIRAPLGDTSQTIYNQFCQPTSITDAANTNTQTLTYDGNFNLKQVTDLENGPNTQVLSATYDTMGNVLTSTDANGKTTQNEYDSRGNLIQITDPLNDITHMVYDGMDRLVSQADPRGNTTQFTYDALGNLKQKTDAMGNATTYTYDNNGNKLSETDANKNPTSYQYDALNRLTKITYPDNTTKQYTYDFRNNKLTEIDQAGHETFYVYDLAGQLKSVTYAYGTADAGTVQYTYDLDGKVKTVQDELGNTTTYNYDQAERVTTVQDATTNPPTKYGYDADNRLTSIQDPDGNTVQRAYYPRNWLKTITYPATSTQPITTTQYTYDGMGRVLTTQDQGSQTTTDTYDPIGRLTSVTDAQTQKTQYFYDAASNLQFVEDALGRFTSYQYDPLNRLSLRILPLGMTEYRTYDPVGNLHTKQDFNGKITTYNYDTLNRPLQRIPDASLHQTTVSFTYTPTGKRLSITDASGTTSYTSYDNRDRLKTKVTPEGTLTYTYDAHSNLLTIASSNTNGASVQYTYDALNRLATAKDLRMAALGGPSTAASYGYDPAGNLTAMGYPNALQAGNTFDTLNRMTQTCIATSAPACSASQKLASFAYMLGYAGNRTGVTELNGRNVTYGYDNDYRLKSETIASDPAGNNGAESYTYDAAGNRLTLNSTIPSLSGANTYSYDANGRLTTDTYDNDGNTTASGGITNTYDFENHLLKHGSSVSLVYDGDGNRVSETAGSATTKYLIDDLNPTGYPQVLDELVSGSVTRTYAYGLQRISENQLVGSTWTPSFYGYDGHGNVRFLANSSGTITDTYTYDAFGMQIARTGTTANVYQYSDEWLDSNLSFYNLRARYYNMLTGRFETMDPWSGIITDPASLHKYVYTRNNPVNRVDPSGRADSGEYITLDLRAIRILLKESQAYKDCLNLLISARFASDEEFLGLSMRDPLYFDEVVGALAARCFSGLFANLN